LPDQRGAQLEAACVLVAGIHGSLPAYVFTLDIRRLAFGRNKLGARSP
jgi:hypothetical protein